MWQVTVLSRGLGGKYLILGNSKGIDSAVYHLCLTERTLSFIRKDRESPQAELSLSSIRSCGSLKNYFFLEVSMIEIMCLPSLGTTFFLRYTPGDSKMVWLAHCCFGRVGQFGFGISQFSLYTGWSETHVS